MTDPETNMHHHEGQDARIRLQKSLESLKSSMADLNGKQRQPNPQEIPQPISQDYRKLLTTLVFGIPIEIRSPRPQEFFRRRPDPSYSTTMPLIQLREEKKYYLVDKTLHENLKLDLQLFDLVTCINHSGNVFLWPVRLSDRRGQQDPWLMGMKQALSKAEDQWVRMVRKSSGTGYEIRVSELDDQPEWPDMSYEELVITAFHDYYINDLNHHVVKALLGRK
ncbi:MAG: hypothetical protein C4523_14510 [Myxococcales bacterium]|nr:MAG: hypothetical protein C4523_14510 [Myxococcales bacterium]